MNTENTKIQDKERVDLTVERLLGFKKAKHLNAVFKTNVKTSRAYQRLLI
jgi:hypothetical protein